MTWVRYDDNWYDHPKVIETSFEARGFHVTATTYCGRHLTDGRLTSRQIAHLSEGRTELAQELVDHRLMERDGDAWVLHDFLDYNPSRAENEAKREGAKERAAASRRTCAARAAHVRETPGRDGTGKNTAKTSKKIDQDNLPDGLSAVLVARASGVLDTLRRIHADRGGNTPTLRGVGLALQAFPDRDHLVVVGELEHWALAGNGQARTIRDWVRQFRVFLERAPAATPTVTTAATVNGHKSRREQPDFVWDADAQVERAKTTYGLHDLDPASVPPL
jgi:hypothetical protein